MAVVTTVAVITRGPRKAVSTRGLRKAPKKVPKKVVMVILAGN